MSNFEFALIGVGIVVAVVSAYAMGISKWHDWQDRKRAQKHAH